VRVGLLDHDALTDGLGTPDPIEEPFTDGGDVCNMATLTNYFSDGAAIDSSLTSGGATVTASVDEVADWGFTLAAPAAITITAENEIADPVITLYDGSGG